MNFKFKSLRDVTATCKILLLLFSVLFCTKICFFSTQDFNFLLMVAESSIVWASRRVQE